DLQNRLVRHSPAGRQAGTPRTLDAFLDPYPRAASGLIEVMDTAFAHVGGAAKVRADAYRGEHSTSGDSLPSDPNSGRCMTIVSPAKPKY
ncbi:MAG TPA: hypothetical protein VML19_04625, partial [Verrucomicrobiae bacterium]|nr:hypothetical protein [Verrucomicrobiae bacterium]